MRLRCEVAVHALNALSSSGMSVNLFQDWTLVTPKTKGHPKVAFCLSCLVEVASLELDI